MKGNMNKLTLKVSEIKNNPNNPRIIRDDKFKKLVKSLKELPIMLEKRPVIIDENNVIIGGNMRHKAAKEAGLKEIPIERFTRDDAERNNIEAKKLDPNYIEKTYEEQVREMVIKDNVSGGEWDWDILANEWDQDELDDWGLDLPADWAEEPEIVEDEAPEVSDEPPVSKLGEVYQLGRHKVFCGDSTLRTSYEKLMGGKNADLVFTDPPYGMRKENEGVLNDNLNYDKLLEFNKLWIPLTFDFMKENGSWYCWGIDEPLMDIYSHILKPMAREQKLTFRNLITWFKNPSGLGDGQNNPQARSYGVITEKCLFVMGGVQGFNTNSDNYYEGWEPIRSYLETEMNKVGGSKKWKEALGNQMGGHYFTKSQWVFPTKEAYEKLQAYAKGEAFKKDYEAFKKDYEEIKKDYEEIKKEWQDSRAYFDNTHDLMTEVWQFDRTTQQEREGTGEHATPKPLALCSRAIKSSSREGEIVLDVFLGSGSTLIACEQTDRTCYGMELDPRYVDVIRKRYWKYVNNNNEEGWQENTPAIEEK
jgi:DNA modification methylase